MQVDERIPVSNCAERPRALREALAVFGGVGAVTWIASRMEALPLLRNHLHLVVGTLFLLVALRCAERLPGGLPRYGLSLGGLFADETAEPAEAGRFGAVRELAGALIAALPAFFRELAVAVLVCAAIFPPFILGFYLWHAPPRPFVFLPQRELGSYLMTQVLVVGLPEEAFFRGYLQGRLRDALPGRMRWLRVELSAAAWLLQALLFALLHFVIDWHVARLAVFFPALLFGWLAALRGGIGAAILVHAACNLLSDLLVRGWL
jgi:membrane protease YdiL (CAAX protease family)